MGRIIVIEDNIIYSDFVCRLLENKGFCCMAASNCNGARKLFAKMQEDDIVLADMRLPDGDGIDLLEELRKQGRNNPYIIMTEHGEIPIAVRSLKLGAEDFIPKDLLEINLPPLLKALQKRLEHHEIPIYERQSAAFREIDHKIKLVANTNMSVLILGESGTGKELIAEAIHDGSPRRESPFVKVNLGGVSQSLFESEMFGHRKGAFTDAYTDRTGRFEMADRGTIFLDEIGELDLSCQVKLLRVLQDQTFEVLGDSRPRRVDVRVVSATNRDLAQMVSAHTFREDLFYRINLITIHLPALRERREDIPLLVRHFVRGQVERGGLRPVEVSAEAMDYLQRLPYPGNIRELKNLVERTLLVSGHSLLTVADFEANYHPVQGHEAATVTASGLTLEDMERQTIEQALRCHDGNVSQAALQLGLSRAALYRRMEKYGIHL